MGNERQTSPSHAGPAVSRAQAPVRRVPGGSYLPMIPPADTLAETSPDRLQPLVLHLPVAKPSTRQQSQPSANEIASYGNYAKLRWQPEKQAASGWSHANGRRMYQKAYVDSGAYDTSA
jgi:hypothetical protein